MLAIDWVFVPQIVSFLLLLFPNIYHFFGEGTDGGFFYISMTTWYCYGRLSETWLRPIMNVDFPDWDPYQVLFPWLGPL